MHAMSSFVGRLVFAATCVIGWLIFPLIILAGFLGLLFYAVIAELVSTIFARPTSAGHDDGVRNAAVRDTLGARRPRLRGPLFP